MEEEVMEPLRSPEWMMTMRRPLALGDGRVVMTMIYYQCVCGKVHLPLGRYCTCGEEFPHRYRYESCRSAA